MHPAITSFDNTNPNDFDFDPARDVPESLRQYLIAIEGPRDIYVDRVHASERRLRLLYRRFLNQITYGCRSSRCDVPTCFSYRKRTSAAAIRPFTDVSARALAAKCVEQYASHGRDIGRVSRREYGKSRATTGTANGNVHNDGLCRNDPVIPWYADPDEYLAKIRAIASKDSSRRHHNAPTKQSITQQQLGHSSRRSLATSSALTPNGDPVPKQLSKCEDLGSAQQEDPTDKATEPDKRASHSLETITPVLSSDGNDLPGTAHSACATHAHRSRKDHASFSQSLFSNPGLRALDQPPDAKLEEDATLGKYHYANTLANVVPKQDNCPVNPSHSHPSNTAEWKPTGQHPQKLPEASRRLQHITPSTVRSAYTFKLLPPSAILWLRNMLVRRSEHSKQKPSESPALDALDRFVEQCLYFVLSDARRLMSSVSTWDEYVKFRSIEAPMGVQLAPRQTIRRFTPRNEDIVPAMEASTRRKFAADNIASTFGPAHPKWTSVLIVCTDLVQFVPGNQGRPRIMHHVLQALEQGFIVPSWMKQLKVSPPSAADGSSSLINNEVAQLVILALNVSAAMQHVIPNSDAIHEKRKTTRYSGVSLHEGHCMNGTSPKALTRSPLLAVEPSCDPAEIANDGFAASLWPYERDFSELFTAIASLISFRIALDVARKALKAQPCDMIPDAKIVKTITNFLCSPVMDQSEAGIQLLQFMLAVLLVKWDRRPVVQRAGPIGGALEMLRGLYQTRADLDLSDSDFELPFLADTFDEFEMPYDWLCFKPDAAHMHILQFPFLFPPALIVRYFRSLNFKIMKLSHEKALEIYTNAKGQMIHARWPQPRGMDEVLEKARPHMARYFVMTIRRDHILEDAIGQIWRRERQELMRPLRVRLGQDDGEEGLDHGGVQQEFFRLVFAEAFDVQYGMFTTDPTTRTTWFQPTSLEPLYKYEALGILMSLAVFNGVTIPITMPLAFYRKVLGLKVKQIEHIADGWPELARSFEQLLDWDEGDVGDVIGRTYEFTYEAFGTQVSIDMSSKSAHTSRQHIEPRRKTSRSELQKSDGFKNGDKYLGKFASLEINEIDSASATSSTSSLNSSEVEQEAPLVSNDNRDDFVKDYIKHLTDITIAPQFTAFLRGLHTLLSPRSLTLFTPLVLKLLIEGLPTSQPLDIHLWKEATELDGFLPSDPFITWFWDILAEDFSQEQLRALLAFVTASDRIPVGGWDGVIFIIQRNGDEDGRLPTSQTCYGRLLLPEYSSREVLKGRLEWAVDNSWGFWMA